MKSTFYSTALHVAIIMDGNGRWATRRGLPRIAGHRAGAEAVRRTVETACETGVGGLTLFAFSADNWKRPATEVDALMSLFQAFLKSETTRCRDEGVRLRVIGRRDRLSPGLAAAIADSERATAGGKRLDLRIAVDYSSRDSIVEAARSLPVPACRERLAAFLPAPDVDLLIRTGGEQRLSDFLLWECAYAELLFSPKMWPDFEGADLIAALDQFRSRQRRFGGLVEMAALNG